MKDRLWIDTADVAKFVRKDLKAAFPAAKFSVRISRYSGGSSIRVAWTDGPTKKAVKAVVGDMHSCTFDGMIDLESSHDSVYKGETVHFGNSYIDFSREYSDAFLARVIEAAAEHYHAEPPTIEDFRTGKAWDSSPIANWNRELYWSWQNVICRAAEDRTELRHTLRVA